MMFLILKKKKKEGWRDSKAGKILALHTAYVSFDPCYVIYSPSALVGMVLECSHNTESEIIPDHRTHKDVTQNQKQREQYSL